MLSRWVLLLVGILCLGGCASNEPLDYLPSTPAYAAINMETLRNSEGLKKLLDTVMSTEPGSEDLLSAKVDRLYLAIDGGLSANSRNAYGVITGKDGMADSVIAELKKQGGVEGKMAGRSVVTSGTGERALSVSPVGSNGLILFASEFDLERMIAVSKKKQANARTSLIFTKTESALQNHSVVLVADTKPIVDMIGPQLEQVRKFSPGAAEALPKVRSLLFTADWNEQPVLEATLGLPGREDADKLAGAANLALMMARNMPVISQAPMGLGKTIQEVKAEASDDGVTLKLAIPKEQADMVLNTVTRGTGALQDKTSTRLPKPTE